MQDNNYIVLLLCGGSGSRFKSQVPKQYVQIHGKTIIEHTIDAFLKVPQIGQIRVVTAPNDNYINDVLAKYPSQVVISKVGGDNRMDSMKNGLKVLNCADNDWVLVHDAVRCCIRPQTIMRMIETLKQDEVGGILAIQATDTVKIGDGTLINSTLDRKIVYLAQTPQMFRHKVLNAAINQADLNFATDDASLVESLGLKVKLIMGEATNIKVTYKDDIHLATAILSHP